MRQLALLSLTAMVLATTGCADKGGKEVHAANPFFSVSSLPFHAPRFDKIRDADFKPAIDSGIAQQQHDIRQIASNPETPTFANTFIPLEKSGQLLARVMGVFNLLTSANTNPVLQQVQQEEAPKLAANQDAIYLNSRLFGRVRQIYEARDTLKLDSESLRLVEYYYRKFEMAGAGLPDSAKTRLKKLNEEEATLSTRFTNKLLAATKEGALVASDTSTLAGLSPGQMKAASEAAAARGLKGKWLIPLQNTTQQPALQSLTDRATRKKLFEASWTRAELGDSDDTRGTIQRLAEVRAGKAKLLGFPDYAAWKLQDQMAKTPQRVQQFLARLIPAATAKAHEEAAAIQAVIDRDKGGFTLQPWDWNFYAEQLRRTKYDLDQDEVRSYFVLDTVLREGVFYAANRLYGLTFKERHDVPVYQPDVKVFEVYDKDGKALGLFYCDYFKRDNKSGGAWMDNIVVQSRLLGTAPVIYNVANFTKPAPGQPALISFDDVTTMFHEFGHALHGFFASQEYPSLSGTNVARDFVEFPSQFNEHWALDTSVLKHYAKNYRTGQPIPEALVERIKKAATFNQGYMLTELLAAAELDMQWHLLPGGVTVDNVDSFETAALDKTHLNLRQVPPRYRSSYFMHIWGNGYAAAYYAYLWTEMLDDNVYAWFEQHGGLTRAGGQRLRDMILSRGNTEDYDKMFRDFCGHDPEIGPMLKDRGLPPR